MVLGYSGHRKWIPTFKRQGCQDSGAPGFCPFLILGLWPSLWFCELSDIPHGSGSQHQAWLSGAPPHTQAERVVCHVQRCLHPCGWCSFGHLFISHSGWRLWLITADKTHAGEGLLWFVSRTERKNLMLDVTKESFQVTWAALQKMLAKNHKRKMSWAIWVWKKFPLQAGRVDSSCLSAGSSWVMGATPVVTLRFEEV